jgi:chorismate-pyruvate lyase
MPESLAQQITEPVAIAHPLDEFYARTGLELPPIKRVSGEQVPEPYRSLLVHQNDMTSTLENFYRDRIHLRVVGRDRRNGHYYREVVLQLDGNDRPVEFGAIKINLDLFATEAQAQILQERHPLGRILKEGGIKFSSRPQGFLRIASDPLINDLLRLGGMQLLYGRRNTLFDGEGRHLAEIVEILPPAVR